MASGIYICTHCDRFKYCCSPARLQEPASLIDCPEDEEGGVDEY